MGWPGGRSGRLDLPAACRGVQPEGGEAGQVDRGGEQLEVLGDSDQAAHAGASAAVAATQQMGEFAFHLGPGRPIVGQPRGITLAGAGGAKCGLMGMDGDHATAGAGGARLAQRADAARDAEPARPPPPWAGRIATVTRAGQVTVCPLRSTRNWSLPKRPPGPVGTWVLTIGVSPCWSSQARWVPVP